MLTDSIMAQLVVSITVLLTIHTAAGEDPCSICKNIAEKFNEGVKKTAKSNFGGGNTHWEEKSLGTWQFSETRLVEITESICPAHECYSFMEQYEEDLEEWWFKRFAKGKDQDLHKYFCVELTKVCCPKNTFGRDCKPCPGNTEKPCTGYGVCKGEGSRQGTGKCDCNEGYAGDLCDKCAQGFYRAVENGEPTSCKSCHESCEGGCFTEGPVGCTECKKGWIKDNGACEDVNECEDKDGSSMCAADKFCRNTPGSHECEGCNSACDGCTGFGAHKCKQCKHMYYYHVHECKACHSACNTGCAGLGPESCDECKDGYTLNEEDICQDINECDAEISPCDLHETCSNSQGSYTCEECDKACNGCTGESNHDCKECMSGYEKSQDGNACDDMDECMGEERVCKGEHERCMNTVGGYDCTCIKGYTRKGGKCERKQKAMVTYSLPACRICRDIVKGIRQGITKTDKQNFGGGNTQWEEKKLGVYATSETRYVEITEEVCSQSDKDCNRMMETNEKYLDQWWFSHYTKQKDTDLHEYLCINRIEACCPNGTFGPSCTTCPGNKLKPCNLNGECDGQGTRLGTGKCKCSDGYSGDDCNECDTVHFQVQKGASAIVCEACDKSCDESCTEAGPLGCDSCKKGYTESEGEGCKDLDECALNDRICKENTFCKNAKGSHNCESCNSACKGCSGPGNDKCLECALSYFQEGLQCLECHDACDGCTGAGPTKCLVCLTGWELQDGTCIDINECQATTNPCANNQYCLNNLGSFRCHACHTACDGCKASGPDKCTSCGNGFELQGGPTCADIDECKDDHVCVAESERCENTVGSYKCHCADKYTRKDGECVKEKDKTCPQSDRKGSQTKQAKTAQTKSSPSSKKGKGKHAGRKKSKAKKQQLQADSIKYATSLGGFTLVGFFLRKSWLAQLVFTSTFWIYLYWFSMRFELDSKHASRRL